MSKQRVWLATRPMGLKFKPHSPFFGKGLKWVAMKSVPVVRGKSINNVAVKSAKYRFISNQLQNSVVHQSTG
jgi:hypothetical protein